MSVSTPQFKAVIFDLDGTIADTLPLCIRSFREAIEPLTNTKLSDHDIIQTFGPSEEGTIQALAPNHYDQALADYLHHYQSNHHTCPAPFPGIIDLLETLQNNHIRIAMVTGKGPLSTDISLQQFDIAHYFEIIETGHPLGPRKPQGIQNVIHHFQTIDNTQILYVGDAPSDITSCNTANIPIAAAAWADTAEPTQLQNLNPDYFFTSIPTFTNWLTSNI